VGTIVTAPPPSNRRRSARPTDHAQGRRARRVPIRRPGVNGRRRSPGPEGSNPSCRTHLCGGGGTGKRTELLISASQLPW